MLEPECFEPLDEHALFVVGHPVHLPEPHCPANDTPNPADAPGRAIPAPPAPEREHRIPRARRTSSTAPFDTFGATMDDLLRNERGGDSIAVVPIGPDRLEAWRTSAPPEASAWVGRTGFAASAGSTCLVPGHGGRLACVLAGIGRHGDPWDDLRDDPWALAHVPEAVPAGAYHLDPDWLDPGWSSRRLEGAALGWALAAYRFDRYRKAPPPSATLFPGTAATADAARVRARAVARVRDLINTPAGDMMPEDLATAASDLAAGHGAGLRVVTGEALLDEGYPAIHAVGRASAHPPRLIDLTWGDPGAPRLTLVGKGVCFDSGGLDIKSAGGMRLMKKDMGGAAHAIGLADLVMSTALPVRLRLLAPAVENAIAGNAYRPGDVIPDPQGPDHRGREHRRGRPDRAERRAGRRRRRRPRPDDRLRDPHRRGPHRPRDRSAPRCSPTTTRSPAASRRPGATSTTRSGGCRCTHRTAS